MVLRKILKLRIKDIAIIRSGIFAKPSPHGDVNYLQVRNFSKSGDLNNIVHPELQMNSRIKKYTLHEGDVLFAAKGAKNFAVKVERDFGNVVASSSFFILRIKPNCTEKIIPEFLVWSLNHSTNKQVLKSRAIGTGLPSISKTVLEDLEIYIPDIKTQQTILKIHELRNKEKHIKSKIEELREQQIQQILLKAISG